MRVLAIGGSGFIGRFAVTALEELDWRRQIAGTAGWTGRIVVVPNEAAPAHLKIRGNLRQHWVVDSGRIRRELGYRERVPRVQALRKTVEWERANPPARVEPEEFDDAAEDAAIRAQAEWEP